MITRRSFLAAGAAAPVAGGGPDFSEVRKLIREKLDGDGVPSLAVAVCRRGEMLWEEGFGWADREGRVAATPETPYSLASITKPFTATAVMMLAERKRVPLDSALEAHLAPLALRTYVGEPKDVTVRRTLNHIAGLPLHFQFFYEDDADKWPAIEDTIRRYGMVPFPPGERYRYSNLGYAILGHIISKRSGMSYAEFVRKEILGPLGMTRSYAGRDAARPMAARYLRTFGKLPYYEADTPGGSILVASARDLIRFANFHLKLSRGPRLSEAGIEEMQRSVAPAGPDSGYGLGWMVREDHHGYRSVSHTGSMPGVATALRLLPSEKIAVAALCNASHPLPHQAADAILAAILPEYRRRLEESRKQSRPRPRSGGWQAPPPELAGDWSGKVVTYAGEQPISMSFKAGGDVHVRLGTGLRALLNDVEFTGGRLTGRMLGDIGTPDANRHGNYTLRMEVVLRGGAVKGVIETAPNADVRRMTGGLSHWVEMRRA